MRADDLIQAMIEAFEGGGDAEGYATRRELQKILGLSKEAVLARLHLLNDQGRLVSRRVRRTRLDGEPCRPQAYKLVDVKDLADADE